MVCFVIIKSVDFSKREDKSLSGNDIYLTIDIVFLSFFSEIKNLVFLKLI